MKIFLEKYIPENKQNYYCRKSGITSVTIRNWKKYNNPATFELICFVETIAIEQKINFDLLIVEAIKTMVKYEKTL
tara:strand:+ start:214 stop:441 length:228 start_codon:yes stop_codon:yes gene_type:complete